ncbi:YeeE/YedE thiosulfate transporter family protein [Thermoanaerobacter sp. CM-CNRG TB177]|uniref:YeeE/YedE thiosulfate transporter family protein n=1 Tax=Thermoanaerobacter sp. CM-CNRG TB177 TaxID=2800659 RepID=UPI001BDF5438|nr:YeeE/YedE thiosulfate transporter family protein [Thermoanaerobacter sp. CM-CNRG TB177]MBT1279057.1 YeeE/YedE family protein [Thermoanaerobacter sp. CM-CNRG TB177]
MEAVKKSKKKKANQFPYGVALLVVIVIIGIILSKQSPKLGLYWAFGIAFGFVLQKARFCFTASLRDPVLTGSTSLTRAVIVAFMIATIGFAAIQYNAYLRGEAIPGNIAPVGIHTVIGATMFGIGMVIAGGCASGTLMRVGEGFMMQWLSIIFFIIGSLWGARDFGWWTKVSIAKSPKVFLPDVFGWGVAFFGQLILLGLLFILAEWYEYKRFNAKN